MAGMGPAPKADADRRRTNAPTFGWVDLPADGRQGPPPSLPHPGKWLEDGWPVATRSAWKDLWATPQATQWDQTGKSLHAWANLHAASEVNGPVPARASEMRQIEDRHGLNPRALLQLRWRITVDAPAESAPQVSGRRKNAAMDRKTRILKVVTDAKKEG